MINQKESTQKLQGLFYQSNSIKSSNPIKSQLLKKNKKNFTQTQFKQGHWSFQEKLNCITFIQHHLSQFNPQNSKSLWHLFKAMSNYINSRSPYQCRSHYQKLISKFCNPQDMVQCLKSSFSESSIKKAHRKFLQYKSSLQKNKDKKYQSDQIQSLNKNQTGHVKKQTINQASSITVNFVKDSQKMNSIELIYQLKQQLEMLKRLYMQQMAKNIALCGYERYNPFHAQNN